MDKWNPFSPKSSGIMGCWYYFHDIVRRVVRIDNEITNNHQNDADNVASQTIVNDFNVLVLTNKYQAGNGLRNNAYVIPITFGARTVNMAVPMCYALPMFAQALI